MQSSYRPDIDGLRALAVSAVVIFHAFPAVLPGGFIGVDVFFVISGYLISGILIRALSNGSFSLIDFYARRIRRIFPALIVVLAASLGLGWYCLLASEYMQLGKHTLGASLFISNAMLWSEAGYFDKGAETKPLLHLWSLAVEEQFYIVFPLLLWACWKKPRWCVALVGLLAASSFFYNITQVATDPSAAFYSPLSRFWEIACGGLLAYGHWYKTQPKTTGPVMGFRRWLFQARFFPGHLFQAPLFQAPLFRGFAQGLAKQSALIGALILLPSFILIDQARAFPGFWASFPVLATLLLLQAGPQAQVNRYLLSNPLLVAIGLISYPLYLWHWVVLSFAQIQLSGPPSTAVRLGAICFSVLLAWLSYVLVERPIRLGRYGIAKAIALVAVMIVLGVLGWHIHREGGIAERNVGNIAVDLVDSYQVLSIPKVSRGNTAPELPSSAVDQAGNSSGKHSAGHISTDHISGLISNELPSLADQSTRQGTRQSTLPEIAIARDDIHNDLIDTRLKRSLRNDDPHIVKLFNAKLKAARYKVCNMHSTEGSSEPLAGYLKNNQKCIQLAADKKNILIIGDSAAADLYIALSRAYPEVNFLQITGSACKPFLAAYNGEAPQCQALMGYALSFAETTPLDGVILSSTWVKDYYFIETELRRLRQAGQHLMLVGPPLTFTAEAPIILQRARRGESIHQALDRNLSHEHIQRSNEMADFASKQGVAYLNWQQLYCERGCPIFNTEGTLMILDKFHLTIPGADRLGQQIRAHKVLEQGFGF